MTGYHNHLIEGDWTADADGQVSIVGRGPGGVYISAPGSLPLETGAVIIDAADSINLVAGTMGLSVTKTSEVEGQMVVAGSLGKILLTMGVPEIGPQVEITPESITLSVGPPDLGASIKITAAGITLQVAENSFTIDPVAISETVAEVITRKASPEGHQLAAAETQASVGVAGITLESPMISQTADATVTTSDAIADVSTSGARTESAGIRMLS